MEKTKEKKIEEHADRFPQLYPQKMYGEFEKRIVNEKLSSSPLLFLDNQTKGKIIFFLIYLDDAFF